MSHVEKYLRNCRELTRFCSRNGWIDNTSIHFTVVVEGSGELIIDVEFEELVLEDYGTRSRRIPCFGQVHLYLDRFGRVVRAAAL